MQPQPPPLRSLHVRTASYGGAEGGLSSFAPAPSLPLSASSSTLYALGSGDPRRDSGDSRLGGSAPGHARSLSGEREAAKARARAQPHLLALSRTRRTLEWALSAALLLWLLVIFFSGHGRFDVGGPGRRRDGTNAGPPPGASGAAVASAFCTAPGAPPPGRFLLPRATYSPGRGVVAAGGRKGARVFLLTALNADAPLAAQTLTAFLQHYARLGVAPQHTLVLAQVGAVGGSTSTTAFDALAQVADEAGAFLDVWVGPLPPFSATALRWTALLARHARAGDWVLLLDADELLLMPGTHTLPSAAAAAAKLGYTALLGSRVEVTRSRGDLLQMEREATAPDARAPPLRRCVVPAGSGCAGVWDRGAMRVGVLGAAGVAGLRPLIDVGFDDRSPANEDPRLGDQEVYRVPFAMLHPGWGLGAPERARARAAALSACLGADHGASRAAASLADGLQQSHGWLTQAACAPLRCPSDRTGAGSANNGTTASKGRASPSSDALSSPSGGRRIAMVSSVWDHVDGVSKTLQTVAAHLLVRRDDTEVMVLTPDVIGGGLATLPLRSGARTAASKQPGLVVVPIPSLPAPGRPDYRWAPPLTSRASAELALFAPDAVHAAAPDFLGHSAVAWARKHNVCSLCTYHTAFPTYLQYYGVGLLEPAVSAFMARFYNKCDFVAVPSYAAADSLALAGVPRAKMGFFPRGVNATLYRRSRRRDSWRTEVAMAQPGELVVLWVARMVREKGLDTFADALKELWLRRTQPLSSAAHATPPPFRVVVAGTGPDLAWLQTQLPPTTQSSSSTAAGDPPALPVVYLGHASGEQLATALASSDVFFFPSRTEVFPNNIAEAMASGLTVLVEDVGVVRALVRHNKTGWLVAPQKRAAGLLTGAAARAAAVGPHVEALTMLMNDDALRARLGMAAAATAQGLTWRRAVGALVRGYDACAQRKRAELDARKGAGGDAAAARGEGVEYVLDWGAEKDALIYRIGANLTGRYEHRPAPGTPGTPSSPMLPPSPPPPSPAAVNGSVAA